MQQITDWLEKLGMSEYAQRFADERIDFSVLPDLTDRDLKDLGVVLGDRRKILRAIAKLDATPANITPIPKQSSILSVAALQPVSITEEASERRHVTVMFCDLVDSTGIAARLDPGEWHSLIRSFLDAASAAVTDLGGTVAKKLDNGLLAMFGYPPTQENDAERAVLAAFATHRTLTELNPINAGTSRPALAARITIDSGPVVIDAAGEIFGDLLNIVMQAKALAEPGVVLVTARVQRQVANLFVAKERGSHKLKDVPEAVTLYRIVRPTSGGHRRPNYDRLLARAVNGVDMSTAEARHAVYERARNALVAQLRFNQPALSKADITKERLALEEAIRKVEAEAARNSRTEIAAEPRSATTPAGAPDGGAQATSGPPQPNRANAPPGNIPWAGGVAEEPPKKPAAQGFRDIRALETAKAAKSVRQTRDAYEEEAPQYPNGEPAASPGSLYSGDLNSIDYDTRQEGGLEPAFAPAQEQPIAVPRVRRRPRRLASADEPTRRPLSYGGLGTLLGVLIILAAVVASIFWQWSPITEFYQFFSHTGTKQQSQVSNEYRVLPGQVTGRAQGVSVPYAQVAPTVAQHVVLHEEDRNDQQHRQYRGSAIWRTELVSAGVAPQLAIIADAEIPERRMTVAWSLRRNIDKSLPASHTIEIKFNLPADFPGGGIANVSGILMAQAEQTRGSPLAGLAVKMTDGFFVIGLSVVDPDIQRNEQLLKGRSWLYIPIVYTNGGRAILALEKGPSGDRAFAEAFTAWEEK